MTKIFLFTFCFLLLNQLSHCEEAQNSTTIADNQSDSSNLQAEVGQSPQPCLQGCQTQQMERNTFNIIIFVVSFMCGFVLLGLLTVLLCTNKRVAKCTKRLCRRNKALANLRQKYDIVSSGLMPQSQFWDKCKAIVRLFQKSMSKSVFAYKMSNQQNQNICKVNIVRLVKQNAFHCIIQIEGEDKMGEWCGSGSILCQSQQIFVWFTQQYNDISKQWKEDNRIFISLTVNPESITGRWFSAKEQQNEATSGTWNLTDPNHIHIGASSQSIQSIEETN